LRGSRNDHPLRLAGALFSVALLLSGCGSGIGGGSGSQPSITVSGASQVRLGGTVIFAATVTNLSNTSVTWQVNGVAGGNSSEGTISSSGVYTPPTVIPASNSVTVTAVSVSSPSVSGSAPLSILNPIPSITAATASPVSGNSYALNVNGAGFVSGAEITAAGASVTTTFVAANEVQATVTIPTGTTSLAITVTNPNPGSAGSNSVNATIYLASVAAAARLLDQATFGPTLATIQQVQSMGVDAWITQQFNTPDTPLANIPSPLPALCSAANTPTNCEESEWWQTVLTGPDQFLQRH
jgi:hypothetical protein